MFKIRRKRNGRSEHQTHHWRGGARRRSSQRRTLLRVEPLERRQLLDAGLAGELWEAATAPDLEWLTYVGGAESDQIRDVAVDGYGNYLICGQDSASDGDAFISKRSPDGGLLWTYYFPAIAANECEALAVDDAGNVFATGTTFGAGKNTWVEGGFDSRTEGMPLAFIIKLNAAGEHEWSSLTGDPRGYVSWGHDIAVDSNGDVFIVGWHGHSNSNKGSTDGFVRKISDSDIDGDEVGDPRLVWSHSIGGEGYEDVMGIALNSREDLILTGNTDDGAVVMKLANNGNLEPNDPVWSHYLGADLAWYSLNVATDSGDNVLVAGGAAGPNGDRDALVAKLTPNGVPLWDTYIGGAQEEDCLGLAVDADGNAWISGATLSAGDWVKGDLDPVDPPLADGDRDAFVAQINSAGVHVWSSYLGGSNREGAGGIAYDSAGYAVVVGNTESDGLSTDGSPLNGTSDGFVARISLGPPAPPPTRFFSIDDVEVTEGDAGSTTTAAFTVTRAGDLSQSDTVEFATADETAATADNDYVAATYVLSFEPGVATQQVTVAILGDAKYEGDETFVARLNNPSAGASLTDAEGVATIVNDDAAPVAPPIYVWDIRFETQGVFTTIVVEVQQDADLDGPDSDDPPAVGAYVVVDLYDSEGNAILNEPLTGTTDGDGIFRSTAFKKLASGTQAEVIDLALTDLYWDPLGGLDPTDNDHDADGDGLPDEAFAA